MILNSIPFIWQFFSVLNLIFWWFLKLFIFRFSALQTQILWRVSASLSICSWLLSTSIIFFPSLIMVFLHEASTLPCLCEPWLLNLSLTKISWASLTNFNINFLLINLASLHQLESHIIDRQFSLSHFICNLYCSFSLSWHL